MPSNLNALIRYKTINSCLYGGRRSFSIQELAEKCSEALAEYRGRYDRISERTIRDDIRIMRSDILAFNAPIEQKDGLYFYSDKHYSIYNIRITDSGLIDTIYSQLIKLRNKISHPELEIIIEQICILTKRPYEKPVPAAPETMKEESVRMIFRSMLGDGEAIRPEGLPSGTRRMPESELTAPESGLRYSITSEITWGRIMEVIS